MNLVLIFLIGSFLLGILLGPLAVAVLTRLLASEAGRGIGDWAVGLGLKSVYRPALTFNAANALTLKRRQYDEEHDEQTISFGGLLNSVERTLFDPQDRLHNLFGTPFGFVDERFGLIFDPRDASVGRELTEAQQRGIYETRVERRQRLVESVLGVFTFRGKHDGVNLNHIWSLVGGSFDSQLVRKIHEYYQKGQAPKSDTTALRQLLVPVGAFIAIVLLGMFASGQTGGGAAGAAPTNETSIDIGMALLASAGAGGLERRDKTVLGLLGLLGLGGVAGAYLMFPAFVPVLGIPLPLGIWSVIAIVAGFAVLPFVASFFGRSLGGLGMILGKLYITIGLLAYDRPVITLVSEGEYELREYDDHEWDNEPKWYRFAMTRLGVSHTNDVETWGEDVTETPARVDEMANGPATDGGDRQAPPGFAITDLIAHDGIFGYVPEDVDPDATYVRTDLTTGWFFEAGQNRRLMKTALESAKERYGGGQKPVSDKWILGSTLVAMMMGALFSWVVFF